MDNLVQLGAELQQYLAIVLTDRGSGMFSVTQDTEA